VRAYSAPPTLALFKGATSKGSEGEERKEGKKEGRGREEDEEWR